MNCEDSIAATDHHAAVFDGATTRAGLEWGGTTAGRLAARVLANAVHALKIDADADEAVRQLHDNLRAAYRRLGCYERALNDPLNRPCAVMVAYSRMRREVWRVGDAQALLVARGKIVRYLGGTTPAEELLADIRALVNARAHRAGRSIDDLRSSDPGRALIINVLQSLRTLENQDGLETLGASAINGFNIPKVHVEAVPDSVDEVVLASDGYPGLHTDLARTERDLAARVASDPLMIDHPPATKGVLPGNVSYDDRAYLRIACPNSPVTRHGQS